MSKLTKKVVVAIILVAFFNLPNYVALINPPAEYSFSGTASRFDPWDTNVYLGVINWAQKFGVNYQNAYTTLGGNTHIIYPIYTFLGATFPKVNSLFLYHLLNHIAMFILFLILYKLVEFFYPKKSFLFSTLVVASITLAGGVGWLTKDIIFSPDWEMSPFTLKSSFQKPHMVVSIISEILAIFYFYKSQEKWRVRFFNISVFSTWVLTIINPLYLLSIYLINGFVSYYFHEFKKGSYMNRFIKYLVYTLPPAFLWSIYVLGVKSLNGVVKQNLTSPTLIELLTGYGFFIPLFLLQIYYLLKLKKIGPKSVFLNIWFITGFLLSLSNLPFSRYYLRILFIPLVILAFKNYDFAKNKLNLFLLSFTLLAGSFTTLRLFTSDILNTINADFWVYSSISQKEVFKFLNENSYPGSGVIVNDLQFANLIPANTLNKIYFGHLSQTPDSGNKQISQKRFYNDLEKDILDRKFLKDNSIDYYLIINNKNQNVLTNDKDFVVYSNEEYSILKSN